ncbi:hypothetical protein GPECTOR_7g1222 [Gonium pectorale]|uniref:Mediator complex subunit Med12 domain-containing protein n=1 Tax=Gonium pectorale TaxID=33097 RepID=A0A150GUG4_GONPE|nr:hypothetical protein GPECTOR_7g1222 [Gonium pectorale]|eukprot:KXZ53328.1 hypothetical protein GPECTOR_7g1222 [Gonium pectorale]
MHGQCPEDRLTANLVEHGYKDEHPEYGIDDSNDSLFSLFTLLANTAANSTGGGAAGAAAAALTASAAALQRSAVSMLEAAQRHKLETSQAAPASTAPTPMLSSPSPPSPPHRGSRLAAAVPAVTRLTGDPAAALAQAVAQLPELRPASDVGRRLWMSALAGSAPLGYLAQTAPSMADRRLMLGLLWRNGVPMPRATWFVRIVYTHLARQHLRPLPPPPPLPPGAGPGSASAAGAGGAPAASASAFSAAAAASTPAPPPAAQSISSSTSTTRASLWTADILSHIDSQLAAAAAAEAAAANGSSAFIASQAAGVSSPALPQDYALTVPSPAVTSPDWTTLSTDDIMRLPDSGMGGGGQGPSSVSDDPRVRMLEYPPSAAVHYSARLACAAFLDGLLDTGKLVEWACGHLSAVAAALAGTLPQPAPSGAVAMGGGASSAGGAAGGAATGAGRPLTAAEQLRAEVALQLVKACMGDLVQSQLHVRRFVESTLELLKAAHPVTAPPAAAAPAPPAGRLGASGGGWNASGAGGSIAATPPLACTSPGAEATAFASGLAATAAAASASGAGQALCGMDASVVELALDCLECCARDATAAVLSLDSLPLLVQALRAPWPVFAAGGELAGSSVAGAEVAHTGGNVACGGSELPPAQPREVCPRRRALSDKLAAAHAGLATSVNTRLLSFNTVAALRDLDRAAAAGDVVSGLRTLASACAGDLGSPGPAVQLLGDWVVGLPITAPPALVPGSQLALAAGPAAAASASLAAAAAAGAGVTAGALDLPSRADAADMALPCRTVFACRLLQQLTAEVRRHRADAEAAAMQGLHAPVLTGLASVPAGAAAGGGAAPSSGLAYGAAQAQAQAQARLGASAAGLSRGPGAAAMELGTGAPARPGPSGSIGGADLGSPDLGSGAGPVLQFLVCMTEVGAFSPVAFLQRILVEGSFGAVATVSGRTNAGMADAGPSLDAFSSSLAPHGCDAGVPGERREQAPALAAYLQHLHPDLMSALDEQAAAASQAVANAALMAARPGGRRAFGGGAAAAAAASAAASAASGAAADAAGAGPLSGNAPAASPGLPDAMDVDADGATDRGAAARGPQPQAAAPGGGGRAPGGRGAAGDADLLAEVRQLRPWQQRAVAAAVCRHVNAVLTAALLPAVPFGATAPLLKFASEYSGVCAAAGLARPAELHAASGTSEAGASRPGAGSSAVRHGDLWLLRCLALLEACQCWHCAPQLLLHLAGLHVEATALWATVSPTAPTAAAATAALEGGGGLLWHRLRLQPGVALAAMESLASRLVAAGLVQPALDRLTSWATRYGVPPGPGRRHLSRVTQCAGVLAAAGAAADCQDVRSWWEMFQRPDTSYGQHWLVGELAPYLQSLSATATPGSAGGAPSPTAAASPPAPVAGAAGAAPPGLPQPRVPLLRLSELAVQQLEQARAAPGSSSAVRDPAALAADAAAAFPDAGLRGGISGANSPQRPRFGGGAASPPWLAAAAQEGVLRLILIAVSYGQLALVDAVTLLCCEPASGGSYGASARGGGGGSELSWDEVACRRALLGPPPGLPGGFCRAEAAVRSRMQASLPADLVWASVSEVLIRGVLLPPTPGGGGAASAAGADADTASAVRDAAAALVCHPPLRHCLLAEPRALHARLCSPSSVRAAWTLLAATSTDATGAAPEAPTLRLPQRLVVLSLAAGQLTPMQPVVAHEMATGLDGDSSLMAAVLVAMEAPCFGTSWLLLRLLVDEQAMLATVATVPAAVVAGAGRGAAGAPASAAAVETRRSLREAMEAALTTASGEGAVAGGKDAGAKGPGGGGQSTGGSGELRAADKAFCDAALLALLAAPTRAELSAEMAWQLGKGVGDYLLKSTDWLLQDRKGEQLLGHSNLAQLVARLGRNKPLSGPVPGLEFMAAQGIGAAPGAAGPAPFAVEAALADLALAGLYKAGTTRQREFAGELVRQLVRMADAVRRAALATPPGVAGGMAAGSTAGVAPMGSASGHQQLPPPPQLPLPPPLLVPAGRSRSLGPLSGASAASASRPMAEDPDALSAADADGGGAGGGDGGGDGGGGGGRRRGGMGFGSGRSRRMGGGGGGLLVRSDSRGDLTEALRIGSPGALQVALWLRVRVLMPLMPLIYSDRESDARRNLRSQLVPALVQLLASPLIWAPQASPAPGPPQPGTGCGAAAAAATQPPAGAGTVFGTAFTTAAAAVGEGDMAVTGDGAAAAAAAAATAAGEALPERLLHVLCALVCGQWASWLKPPGQKRLKEVAVYDNIPQLLADLDQALSSAVSTSAAGPAASAASVAPALSWMRERITSALPLPGIAARQLLPLQPRATAASVANAAPVSSEAGALSATGAGGSAAAAIGTLELDPAVVLPLESLAQADDVLAQPFGSWNVNNDAGGHRSHPAVAALKDCMCAACLGEKPGP